MSLALSRDDLLEVTGYKRPKDQLVELHRRGFHRAVISKTTGRVILERAHYDAICAGATSPKVPRLRPSLRTVPA